MGNHQIAVFLGPSCPLDEARMHLPDADYFPPASRGSFYGIINDGYRVIALIDGLFYGKLSVWHKEILFAIDSGITVIGASSMGALRAAELDGSGIIGAGTVYGWYRDGRIDGDDEVALLHQGSADGFSAVTVPLVNLRWQLMHAREAGLIDCRTEERIIHSASMLCFTERTLEAILAPLQDEIDTAALMNWLDGAGDLKRDDAILALGLAAEAFNAMQAAPVPAPTLRAYEYVHANLGIEYFTSERLTSIQAKGGVAGAGTALAAYLDRIDVKHPGYRDLVRARICQRLIVGWAQELKLHSDGAAADTPWDSAPFDAAHRHASGLTPVDIARERRDAHASSALQAQMCHTEARPGAAAVIAAIDRHLAAQAEDAPIPWQRMVKLDGKLVYTLCCLGLRKQIRPPQLAPPAGSAQWDDAAILGDGARVVAYAGWIYDTGPRVFGYMVDPAREVLLAYQYLNCLDLLARETA